MTVSNGIIKLYQSSRGVVGEWLLGTNIGRMSSRGGEGSGLKIKEIVR